MVCVSVCVYRQIPRQALTSFLVVLVGALKEHHPW